MGWFVFMPLTWLTFPGSLAAMVCVSYWAIDRGSHRQTLIE